MRRCVLLWGRSSSSTTCHGLDVGSVYERLMEVADTACDIDVARDGQRNDRNPTEGEPWVTFLDMCCHVTTVVTLEYHALIFRDFLSEGVLAAHEEEEHC